MGRAGERGDDGYQQDQAERAGGVCIGGVRGRSIEECRGDDHQQDDREHIEKADTGREPAPRPASCKRLACSTNQIQTSSA